MGNYWIIIVEVDELIKKLDNIFEPYVGSMHKSDKELLRSIGLIKDLFLQKNPKYTNYMGFVVIQIHTETIETDDGDVLWKFSGFDIIKHI